MSAVSDKPVAVNAKPNKEIARMFGFVPKIPLKAGRVTTPGGDFKELAPKSTVLSCRGKSAKRGGGANFFVTLEPGRR